MDISKEVDTSRLGEAPPELTVGAAVDEVAPGVLVAVILGVLCAIGLLFSFAVLMDRWNRRLNVARTRVSGPKHLSLPRSTKIAILDDMCPSPESDPPSPSAPKC